VEPIIDVTISKLGSVGIHVRRTQHSLEGAILVLEVQDCRPVVRKVLAEGAGGARRHFREVIVRIHANIEAIDMSE
jgi:hypothetical protein